ncbi:MAG: hypothetical protein OJF50_002720 [Nitrospira sp.]|nr:hypothetical protein [Nitrospira sp.]
MSASFRSSYPLRKEIHEFVRSCEMLLSSPVFLGNAPLSPNERKIVQYYSEELKAYLLASEIC